MNTRTSDKIRTYFTIQVTTASEVKTVCFIHEQCVSLLRHAHSCGPVKKRALLNKVQNLLSLLQRSLSIADPTSKSLLLLYDYCYCQLEEFSEERCTNALAILSALTITFKELQHSL